MPPRSTDFDHLPTEQRNCQARDLDLLDAQQLVELMHQQDLLALQAVGRARPAIARVIEAAASALGAGGRLIYLGAGTSGRLATLDAAECPPTFGTRPGQVVAIIAGGARALWRAVEGAEDDAVAGRQAIRQRQVGPHDLLCGVSASGITPFVRAALAEARRRGARTALISCAPPQLTREAAELTITLEAGPEIIAGSTRMKAGLATKAVLHAISTGAMILLGKVHDNLMVDVRPTSRKLQQRAARIVGELTGLSPASARRLLARAGGKPKVAIVMHRQQVSLRQARQLLAASGGRLRPLLGARDGAA